MKALLVDDEVISNFVNATMLEQSGLADEIQSVRDAREAIDILKDARSPQSFHPDFILVDLNMPVMNGFEFIEAFQQIPPSEKNAVNIIIVSSSSHPEDLAKAKQLGIKHYLTKPVTEQSLRSALEDLEKKIEEQEE